MSNGVFVNQGCQYVLHYDDKRFFVDKSFLFVADDFTAKKLGCAVGAHCGVITHMLGEGRFQNMGFNLVTEGYKKCLFTHQETSNAAFTKRVGCGVVMHFEGLRLACIKKNGVISLYAADEHTAARLGCGERALCGNITHLTSSKGVHHMRFEFGQQRYECKCLFTYQTSCLPWLMDVLHPGKTML